MAQTQAQVDATTAAIVAGIKTASTVASTIDPAILPYVIIGQAAASAVPGLVDDVYELFQGGNTPVTPVENSALLANILALANPAAL